MVPEDTSDEVCFLHSCNINGTRVLDELLDAVKRTTISTIYVVNTGTPLPKEYATDRVKIIEYSSRTDLFELPTLRIMHSYARKYPGKRILYLHTKGVSYAKNEEVMKRSLDWTRFMLYGLTSHVDACVALLRGGIDTIGCNYSTSPHAHFSGNFWWATTDHIARLPLENLTDKMSAEWWVLSKTCKHHDVHNSNINHFHTLYPASEYTAAIDQHFNQSQ
jgi:hypothetical protein